MCENSIYNVVIIGYGVSGLTLAAGLDPNKRVLIVEHGKPHDQRDHVDSAESLIGCGGAGLFSDGKFSFWPAGTRVWDLEESGLKKSYSMLLEDLRPYLGKEINDLAEPKPLSYDSPKIPSEGWTLKRYQCYYIDLPNRLKLINSLVKKSNATVLYQHLVKSFIKTENSTYELTITDTVTNKEFVVTTKYVVLAGGRFSPLYFQNIPSVFRRVEYGARIVSTADTADVIQEGITDPKYIRQTKEYEARTFCWCKNGETVLTDNLQGIKTYSGRADDEEKKNNCQTNFGLNVRIRSPLAINQGTEVPVRDKNNNQLDRLLQIKPFEIKIQSDEQLANELISIMGEVYGRYYFETLKSLLEKFPSFRDNPNIRLVGPTIEGVGAYPDLDEKTLKVHGENIYCCGDASGIFRGIIASMISGYFVADILNNTA